MERETVDKVSERDNRDSQKNSVGTLREVLFSKKNVVSVALLLVKGILLIFKSIKGNKE